MVPPVTLAVAEPSANPRQDTESFTKDVIISFGCSTKIKESTVQPLASVTFTVCSPAGALVFALVPPKLQLKLYDCVPPVTERYTNPSDWP